MFGITKRISHIWIDVGESYPITYNKNGIEKGIMGLRFSKTKEGIYIYLNRTYKFYPWNRIREMRIRF